jgi:hypothetical protein
MVDRKSCHERWLPSNADGLRLKSLEVDCRRLWLMGGDPEYFVLSISKVDGAKDLSLFVSVSVLIDEDFCLNR